VTTGAQGPSLGGDTLTVLPCSRPSEKQEGNQDEKHCEEGCGLEDWWNSVHLRARCCGPLLFYGADEPKSIVLWFLSGWSPSIGGPGLSIPGRSKDVSKNRKEPGGGDLTDLTPAGVVTLARACDR
jgi:hypothetical protein